MKNNEMKGIWILSIILVICVGILIFVLCKNNSNLIKTIEVSNENDSDENINVSKDDEVLSNNEATEDEIISQDEKLSENEAIKVVEEQWKNLEKMHANEGGYFKANSKTEKVAGREYYAITNYEDIMKKYFSNNGKMVFQNSPKDFLCLTFVDGKLFKFDGGGFTAYSNLKKVSEVNVETNKITATLILNVYKDTNMNKTIEKKTEFVIVKDENDSWLIDNFNLKDFS